MAIRWPLCFMVIPPPDNDISGGRVLWRGVRKTNNRAGQIFRLAAQSLHRSPTAMGEYLRRLKAKLGPAGAITAAARKIARCFTLSLCAKSSLTPRFGKLQASNATSESKLGSLGKRTDSDINWFPLKHSLYKLLNLSRS